MRPFVREILGLVESATAKHVESFVDKVAKENRAGIEEEFYGALKILVDAYLRDRRNVETGPTSHFFKNPKAGLAIKDFFVQGDMPEPGTYLFAWKFVPDAEKVMREAAAKQATAVLLSYKVKLTSKLDSILLAKPVKTFKGTAFHSSGLVTGVLEVSFDDGSSFEARTSITYNTSKHGWPYIQYPLTFQNVVMPDGKVHKKQSEAFMLSDFVRGC